VQEEVGKNAVRATLDGRELRLTNLDKPLWPDGSTKGDLIRYYVEIAPVLLAHLEHRPLTLKRYPNGVKSQFFYEKQAPSHRPEWVPVAPVRHKGEKTINYVLAHDAPTLAWLGNLADLELHTPMHRVREIGPHPPGITEPTMIAFDLDPGEPAALLECLQVAVVLQGMFEHLGLQAFPKTSGSKGLQVYVPLNQPDATYGQTKGFAKAVAELLEAEAGDLVVSRQGKHLRPGKVLVDWSQNDDNKTTVCVYSPRARDRPTVSTPRRAHAGPEPARLARFCANIRSCQTPDPHTAASNGPSARATSRSSGPPRPSCRPSGWAMRCRSASCCATASPSATSVPPCAGSGATASSAPTPRWRTSTTPAPRFRSCGATRSARWASCSRCARRASSAAARWRARAR
jgi:bifunctional non-homologous end joining protein LigD